MPALRTDAIVLHAFDYLESSRILRLLTREGGVRSALARGARRSTRRFGTALDLYAQGSAELHVKPGRDLDALAGFDVVRARPHLAADLARFAGANVIAELTLRFARDDADSALFDVVSAALDDLAAALPGRADDAALAAAWRVLAELGVAPTVDRCAECHAELDAELPARFSHPAGGVVCERCGSLARIGRTLPAGARAALRDWLAGVSHSVQSRAECRAHQRLLREFVHEHLADDRPLRAFDAWERDLLHASGGAA